MIASNAAMDGGCFRPHGCGCYNALGGVFSQKKLRGSKSAWMRILSRIPPPVFSACLRPLRRSVCAGFIELFNRTAGKSGNAPIVNDTFNKSVEALKKEWEISMQSNLYIAQSYANSSVLMNLPLSRLNRRPRYYDAVTHADIRALCVQALAVGPVQVILYPEQ